MPQRSDPPRPPEPVPKEETGCVICGDTRNTIVARGRDTIYATSDETFTFVACSTCGHLYLNPRPTMAALDRIYPSNYATFSGRFSRGDATIAWIKERVLLRRFSSVGLDLPADPVILDVGCGDGSLLASLRRAYPSARLIGIDWHFPDATRRVLAGLDIEMIEAPIESASLPIESIDLVNMNQLIEHVWDPPGVVERCAKALRPGGWLALETPNPEGYDRRYFFRHGSWGSYYWPRHLNLFSPDGLDRLVRGAGLVPERRVDLLAPPCWVYTVMALNRSRARPLRWVEQFFTDTNPMALAPFAVLDALARLVGLPTSNQKLIARRA